MNNTYNRNTIWGAGLAVIAVAFAASARPASAQTPLLSHPAQVQQAFDGWGHDNNRNHDGDQGRDYGRNYGRNRDQDRDRERLRVERERRVEQERREAERARHEAEARQAQWLREHRHDGDRDRHDSYGDRRHDDRG